MLITGTVASVARESREMPFTARTLFRNIFHVARLQEATRVPYILRHFYRWYFGALAILTLLIIRRIIVGI